MQQTLNPDDLATRPENTMPMAMNPMERQKLAQMIMAMKPGQNMLTGQSRITMGPNGPVAMPASQNGFQAPGYR
jgi:hypothetical protein